MQELKYKITTLSPVLISRQSGDRNMTDTFDYIPGRVILGIFASQFISKNKLGNTAHKNTDFEKYFLSDEVMFSNAYIRKEEKEFITSPFSVQKEKENDSMLHDLLFKKIEDEEQTNYVQGYSTIKNNYLEYTNIDKSLNFHHARDEKTGSSKEGVIFNYESIDKGQIFEGSILGEDLTIFKSNFEQEYEAYTGRSKTSQYGKIKLELLDDTKVIVPEIIFSENLSLTFLSDVILYNDEGQSVVTKNALEKYLKQKVSDKLILKKAFIKSSRIDNFVSVWKLKKPSENAFSTGSCFLISGLEEKDKDKLSELTKNGIGERKNEGFGRLAFGIQKENISGGKLEISKNISKPDTEVPEIVKKIITQSTKDIIYRQIKSKAIIDATTFHQNNKKGPSKFHQNNKKGPSKFHQNNKKGLSNSLVGRLESFVKGSKDKSSFDSNISSLRNLAKDKLVECSMNRKSFLDYLLKTKINSDIVISDSNFSGLSDEELKNIYDPLKDDELNNNLYKPYYLTFFSYLRKLMKREGINNEQR